MTPQAWVMAHLHYLRPGKVPLLLWRAMRPTILGTIGGWFVRLDTGAVIGGILGTAWWETTHSGSVMGMELEAVLLFLFAWLSPEAADA